MIKHPLSSAPISSKVTARYILRYFPGAGHIKGFNFQVVRIQGMQTADADDVELIQWNAAIHPPDSIDLRQLERL